MTEIQTAPYVIEGPMETSRFGSVGFRLADKTAPSACRHASREMLNRFQLGWVPGLVDDVVIMVSELVTNACRHASAGSPHPAGSLTLWHPNRRLVVTVHDKHPYVPWRELRAAGADALGESGRGLAIVRQLAAQHLGEVDAVSDEHGGKVLRVAMLLPDVQWPHTYFDPWKRRTVRGA